MRGRGARTGVVGFAAVVELVATVDVDVVRGGEAVELAPPHPASAIAIATPNAAAPRTVTSTAKTSLLSGATSPCSLSAFSRDAKPILNERAQHLQ